VARQPAYFSGDANKVLPTIITQDVGYLQLLDDMRPIEKVRNISAYAVEVSHGLLAD
jgi:hypothetical protein